MRPMILILLYLKKPLDRVLTMFLSYFFVFVVLVGNKSLTVPQ